MSGSFAYHSPTEPQAYVAPQGIRNRFAGSTYQTDPDMTSRPPNMDAETHDVVSDQSRLGGARALNLTDRGT